MGKRTNVPKVNAGSMADIAFLLLIFFLVTTSIETDAGLDRMLPRLEHDPITADVYERNILRVLLNEKGELLVEGTVGELNELKQTAIRFLDNGGIGKGLLGHCNYCKGNNDSESSDNPSKAIISLSSNRMTEYGTYISVQNELVAAYNELRNREAQRLFNQDFTVLEKKYANTNIPTEQKKELRTKIIAIQELFPLKISEIEIEN